MKYVTEIEIYLSLEKVIELFDNPDNLSKWQPELLSFEPISGTPGQVGANSKLKYQMGNRLIEMIETITVRKLPDEFSGTYENKGVFNIVGNRFTKISQNKTKLISEQEFQFEGMMKLIGFIMPGAFKKQTMKYLNQFKEFAEKSGGLE